jgi:calcineurin-like phosphoesterase family protein
MLGGLIFTHIPVHSGGIVGHYRGNVHGHLHCHLVNTSDGQVDTRYFNACLERNNFEPVALEDIKAYFKANGRASDV